MSNPAIVIMAYKRPVSLQRLLDSLAAAHIPAGTPLHISIDHSPQNHEVVALAERYAWPFGAKTVQQQNQHLGLVDHYLACGDLTQTYGALILLEDDLAVARPFYEFASAALNFYRPDHQIAGISLNSLWFNGFSHYRFSPLLDAGDTFFLPIPWYDGQVLWAESWQTWREWQQAGRGQISPADPLHPSFGQFAAEEWFPAFCKYLSTEGRYFVFPRQSYSTNSGAAGVHFIRPTDFFQVSWQQFSRPLHFLSRDNSLAVYDGFFELLPERLGRLAAWLPTDELTVDLNGTKPDHLLITPWLLTSRPVHVAERSFGLQRRPIEANIIEQIAGQSLFLAKKAALRHDRLAAWRQLYRLDRYYRRQRPAPRLVRLAGRLLK